MIGGTIGLAGGAVGGAGAGVGVAHRIEPVTLTCTAEDIFQHIEQSSNYHREGNNVVVEITGLYNCKASQANVLVREASQYAVQ